MASGAYHWDMLLANYILQERNNICKWCFERTDPMNIKLILMWNFTVGWHYWKSAAYESKQKFLSQYLHVKHNPSKTHPLTRKKNYIWKFPQNNQIKNSIKSIIKSNSLNNYSIVPVFCIKKSDGRNSKENFRTLNRGYKNWNLNKTAI